MLKYKINYFLKIKFLFVKDSDGNKHRKDYVKCNEADKSYNSLSVNVDLLDCDYYRFKELDAGAVNAYECEYMNQYYWADFLYNGF